MLKRIIYVGLWHVYLEKSCRHLPVIFQCNINNKKETADAVSVFRPHWQYISGYWNVLVYQLLKLNNIDKFDSVIESDHLTIMLHIMELHHFLSPVAHKEWVHVYLSIHNYVLRNCVQAQIVHYTSLNWQHHFLVCVCLLEKHFNNFNFYDPCKSKSQFAIRPIPFLRLTVAIYLGRPFDEDLCLWVGHVPGAINSHLDTCYIKVFAPADLNGHCCDWWLRYFIRYGYQSHETGTHTLQVKIAWCCQIQAIDWASIDPKLCRRIMSLDPSKLSKVLFHTSYWL